MRRLTGREMGQISVLLRKRFGLNSIRTFTNKRMEIPYDDQVSPLAGLEDGIFQYVNYLNSNWKHHQLINAYLAEFPDDVEMLKFSADLGSFIDITNQSGTDINGLSALEAMVNASPFLDVDVLLSKISRVERTICRIEIKCKDDKCEWGTGFLIGEEHLISNYHVFQTLINSPEKVESINCLFDYKVLANEQDVYKGNLVKLAEENPVEYYSEVGALDRIGSMDLNAAWEPNKLDYAVVRLDQKIGSAAFGPGEAFGNPVKRGWLTFPNPAPNIFSGSHAIILQHPEKGPKKIVFGFEQIEGMDDAQLRVRYKINTKRGSSGSPCFNHKF